MENLFEKLHDDFKAALAARDKKRAIGMIQKALEEKSIEITDLYTYVLGPGLNSIASNEIQQSLSIWEEHVQSGIVRTALEISYPYVLKKSKERQALDLHAIVFCPEEEYHELGARITTDFLVLLGFEATFIGANTPQKEVMNAIERLKPKLVCISVTNYYHLTRIKAMINRIRRAFATLDLKIIVGGYAVDHTPHAKETVGADYYAHSYEDLLDIKEAIL